MSPSIAQEPRKKRYLGHGVATDGLSYTFVTITHEGVLKLSRVFDVMQGDLPIVLGCFQHILEIAMSMAILAYILPQHVRRPSGFPDGRDTLQTTPTMLWSTKTPTFAVPAPPSPETTSSCTYSAKSAVAASWSTVVSRHFRDGVTRRQGGIETIGSKSF